MTIERDAVALMRAAMEAERNAFVQGHDWREECTRREEQLARLLTLLDAFEPDTLSALQADLGKSATEAYTTELALVRAEARLFMRRLGRWMRPKRVLPSLATFPAWGRITHEPYGLVLILSPWNYPFQLVMVPLIGAIAAGNRCIIKPSSQCPATAELLQRLVAKWLSPETATVLLGGHDVSDRLLEQRFDHIFFTGSPEVGRMVMRKAAEHLTPVTLELGGKSPCIVDETADLKLAARRIAFGKAVNAGQTCIAPDYVLAHESIANELVRRIAENWKAFYGSDALESSAWPRIISQKSYNRLMSLLDGAQTVSGGQGRDLRIQPTLVFPTQWEHPLMQEEIFGPILPVIPYNDLGDALEQIRLREAPLALYLFTADTSGARSILRSLPFGGGCINDCLMHIAHHHLPFGGLGTSGMGRYHGRASFQCFTYRKGVLRGAKADNPLRYPPYTARKHKLLRMLLK